MKKPRPSFLPKAPVKTRRASSKQLATVSHETLKRASPAENVRMGFGPKARRYIKKGAKVTKRTASVSMDRYEKTRLHKLYGVASRAEATEMRRTGALSYSSHDQARRVKKAERTRKARSHIDQHARNVAANEGFAHGPRQAEKVLSWLQKQSEKHDRYLASGNDADRLDEDEYRRTVKLAFGYLGADDERLRNMAMSPDIMGIAA